MEPIERKGSTVASMLYPVSAIVQGAVTYIRESKVRRLPLGNALLELKRDQPPVMHI